MRRAMPLEYSRSLRLRLLASRPDGVKQVGHAAIQLLAGDLEQPAVKLERFFAVEKAVEVGLFREESDASR